MVLTLVSKKQETPKTTTFFFKPDKKIDYDAGKFFYLTLPYLNFPDRRGTMREFSAQSSPTEKFLAFTIKIKPAVSGYKKTFMNLKIGETIEADGPHGIYYWPLKPKYTHIMIAGGIGITPMRSRIKYNFDKGDKDASITLLYSVSSKKEVLFLDELNNWKNKLPKFNISINYSDKSGRINKKMLSRFIKKTSVIYWVCGTPSFVTDIENILEELGMAPENILTEKFTGYP